MKTPADKTITFVFGSHPAKVAELRWTARLTFPAGATARTKLALAVEGGDGRPLKSGVFEFAGRRTRITDGKGSITYADFIAGKHETALWLHREGMPPVPGGLTFG